MEAHLDALPEELKLHILSFLDGEPPSSSWYTHAPRLSLADSDMKPLKALSLVSKAWRRLVKLSLFRCIRLKLSALEDIAWPTIPPSTINFRHAIEVRKQQFKHWLFQGVGFPGEAEWTYRHSWQDSAPERAAQWLKMLDSALAGLISFLVTNRLNTNVESMSIVVAGELDDGRADFVREEIHCLIGTATFWDVVFRTIEPSQVTLVAPPSTLACMLSCSIRTLDAWAFPGMSHQLVTLRRPKVRNHTRATPDYTVYNRSEYVHLRFGPGHAARPALASLLYIRPWTHMLVNEGSYLQAYSTYEYFHKEPPGIMSPLGLGFQVPMSLDTLTYHAVFPFHDHVATAVDLMTTGIIRHLKVKLAPSAEDKNWDDPAFVGKADITDCWGEIEQVYHLLCSGTIPSAAVEEGHLAARANLTTFTSGDCKVESIRELLEQRLASLQWVEIDEGIWASPEAAMSRSGYVQELENEV
ncbi:hypothetical protein BDV97DRAFT_398004 [Delphinella strobiligena]|nr:hypothetical protein BDV97DRAFT_398004 [Delphinella strobiligena]